MNYLYMRPILTKLITKVKPNINSIEVHPQLSKEEASSGWRIGELLVHYAMWKLDEILNDITCKWNPN